MIVCTQCSCTAWPVLGLPPDWYKSFEYRARVVREARTVLREMGVDLPPEVEIRVHDTTAETRFLVLPLRPAGTDDWGEERLAALVTREAMIGVAMVTVDAGRHASAPATGTAGGSGLIAVQRSGDVHRSKT